MRSRALLAALAAALVALSGCFGAPENRPPVASAHVSLTQAAVGQEIIFTGVGVDPDGSVVRFEWDFDSDGVIDFTNLTRATVAHAYARPGHFTALFNAYDDRGARGTASVNVSIDARFTVSTDWGTSHGYRIGKAASLNASGVRVQALPAGAAGPTNFTLGSGLEVLDDTTLRVALPASTLERYGSTRVQVFYNEVQGADRVTQAVPFFGAENDPSARYSAAIDELRLASDSQTTLSYRGTLDLRSVGSIVSAAFQGAGSSSGWSLEGGTNTSTAYTFSHLDWNQTLGRYSASQLTLDFAWTATGQLEAVSPTGFTTVVNLTRFEGARVSGNLTYERAQGAGYYVGDQPDSTGTTDYALEATERLAAANGNGLETEALRVFENLTLDGTFGGAPFVLTNRTQRLTATSDAWAHPDLFASWNASGRLGVTNLTDNGSRFLDSDGDGSYNPDARPRFASDGQNFAGLAPAELLEGDAFEVRNSGDAFARLVVGPPRSEVLDAVGFPLVGVEVVTVHAPVEAPAAPWELPGSLSYDLVARGPHAGLRLASTEHLSFGGQTFEKDLALIGKAT